MGRAADVEAMRELGRALAPLLKQGDTVILSGDLGAGKTQFSQGVAEGLGVGTAAVSPTFNIVLSYEDGRIPLRHLDLYRLEQSSELDDLGYGELVGPDSDGVALVEWGRRFTEALPDDFLEVILSSDGEGNRDVHARAVGARSEALLEGWAEALSAKGAEARGSDASELEVSDVQAETIAGYGLSESCQEADVPAVHQKASAVSVPSSDGRFVLAFDTANEVIAIGLGRLDEEACAVEPVATCQVRAHRASNTRLIPLIDDMLVAHGVPHDALACIAVGVGPGSFTGVRIACATAKGIASALGVGLVGLSTLEAVAWGAWAEGQRGELLVVADAMRKEVYPARFLLSDDGVARQGADRVGKAAAVAEEFAGSGLPVVGDGLAKYADLFAPCGLLLGERSWAPAGEGLLQALQAAWQRGDADPLDPERHDPAYVLPVYTRLSDAEENERTRLASSEPRNLRTGVQDAPASDGGIGRKTLHSSAQLQPAPDAAGIAYAPLDSTQAQAVADLEQRLMGTDAWSEALVVDELPRPDRLWWVALHDGAMVGYAGAMVVDGDMQVLKVAVDPSWRRRGIARNLLARVADGARNLGAQTASLEVRASNDGAQALYEALGFQRQGVRPRYYSDREDAVIMAGSLAGLLGSHDEEAQVAGMAISHYENQAQGGAASQPLVLAIESSCDETAAALVDGSGELLADVVASQVDFHSRFGGVVPEIASRKHIEAICGVCEECLDAASRSLERPAGTVRWQDVQAVAATYAPGLVGALVVGVAFAKGAAWALEVPYIEVNHLEGHLYANRINRPDFAPPAVVSLVSGGNTMLAYMADYGSYRVLGETIDDAVGEAFDKVAKALGLGYPGGPVVSRLASEGDPRAIDFPRAMLHSGDLSFSLSGLKTAVVNYLSKERQAGRSLNLPDICASFQQAVIDVQVAKAREALRQTDAPTLCLGGGVAANPALRNAYEQLCRQMGVRLIMPPLHSCGDNAGMIALVALDRFRAGKFAPLSSDAFAHRSIEEPY